MCGKNVLSSVVFGLTIMEFDGKKWQESITRFKRRRSRSSSGSSDASSETDASDSEGVRGGGERGGAGNGNLPGDLLGGLSSHIGDKGRGHLCSNPSCRVKYYREEIESLTAQAVQYRVLLAKAEEEYYQEAQAAVNLHKLKESTRAV